MKYKTGNFLNGTNNKLECINQKLKSVIARYSSLEEFIDKFFLILRVLRSERDHKTAIVAERDTICLPVCIKADGIERCSPAAGERRRCI